MLKATDSSVRAPEGYFTGRTLAELGGDLRAGRTTSVELTGHALDAIAALDPVLNAFITVDAEGATAAARQADAELSRGVDRGPLPACPSASRTSSWSRACPRPWARGTSPATCPTPTPPA
ncbi:hypothetical protein GCM10010149_01340 [Nonomuraea roseoviolacea subsp. roseoviolacea]